MARTTPDPLDFISVEHWIFDLDNTLYPAHTNLFSQIDARMRDFIAQKLNLTLEDAYKLQKQYYYEYGTTLKGLMTEHGIDPEVFLHFVHDIDHSLLIPCPHLCEALPQLPGHCSIYTNGSCFHAGNVLAALDLDRCFHHIIDIIATDYHPKPQAESFELFLQLTGINPARAVMFEDLSRNLIQPKAHGMITVLVVSPEGEKVMHHQDWELSGQQDPHIDYCTSHLGEFVWQLSQSVSYNAYHLT
jgi:putative hydrolase of the HAD superfamily